MYVLCVCACVPVFRTGRGIIRCRLNGSIVRTRSRYRHFSYGFSGTYSGPPQPGQTRVPMVYDAPQFRQFIFFLNEFNSLNFFAEEGYRGGYREGGCLSCDVWGVWCRKVRWAGAGLGCFGVYIP